MRLFLSLLIVGIVLSACAAPQPTAQPEPTATVGPTPAPTFAIPPRLITRAARQRGQIDSAPNKPAVRLPTLPPIPTLATMVDTRAISRAATPRPIVMPRPTSTPEMTATSSPRPSATPIVIHTLGDHEWFKGQAALALDAGETALATGDYRKAIRHYEDALKSHGKPSAKLENKIGLAYTGLEEWGRASQHFSNAIAIDDNPLDRINRGKSYFESDQCDLAITDAKAALDMEPLHEPGFHSDVEAHVLLVSCYAWTGASPAVRQHLDAAITIAKEHNYMAEKTTAMEGWRDEIPGN